MNEAVDKQFIVWRDRAEAAEAEIERLRALNCPYRNPDCPKCNPPDALKTAQGKED